MARASGYRDSESALVQGTNRRLLSLLMPQESDFETSVTADSITISWPDEVPEYIRAYLTGEEQIARHGNFFYSFNLILEGEELESNVYEMVPGDAEIMFEGLQAETDYEVQIESTVRKGEERSEFFIPGEEQLSIAVMTEALPQLSAPTTIDLVATETEIIVSWSSAEAGEATIYQITYTLDGEQTVEVDVSEEMYRITGLSSGTTYSVSIVAQADPQQYIESDAAMFELMTLEPQLPTPTGVSVSADVESALVSWEANEQGATTYLLSIAELEEEAQEVSAVTEGSFSFEDLAPDTAYTLNVVAQAEGMRDSEPYMQSFTTLQEQLLVEDLQATAVEAQVMVSWTSDNRASEYVVTVYEQQGETSTEFVMATENDNEYEFEGSPVTQVHDYGSGTEEKVIVLVS